MGKILMGLGALVVLGGIVAVPVLNEWAEKDHFNAVMAGFYRIPDPEPLSMLIPVLVGIAIALVGVVVMTLEDRPKLSDRR